MNMLSGVEFDRDPMGATLDPAILTHFDPFYGQKLPKIAINGPFVAIRHPGGYKRVDQCGSRLDQGWAHPG